jgi:hypothetical protein
MRASGHPFGTRSSVPRPGVAAAVEAEIRAFRERHARERTFAPLATRLKAERAHEAARVVRRAARDGRIAASGRDELLAVLDRMARLVGTFSQPEQEAAFNAFLRLVNAWADAQPKRAA